MRRSMAAVAEAVAVAAEVVAEVVAAVAAAEEPPCGSSIRYLPHWLLTSWRARHTAPVRPFSDLLSAALRTKPAATLTASQTAPFAPPGPAL